MTSGIIFEVANHRVDGECIVKGRYASIEAGFMVKAFAANSQCRARYHWLVNELRHRNCADVAGIIVPGEVYSTAVTNRQRVKNSLSTKVAMLLVDRFF